MGKLPREGDYVILRLSCTAVEDSGLRAAELDEHGLYVGYIHEVRRMTRALDRLRSQTRTVDP
jgi:hypothetical protein